SLRSPDSVVTTVNSIDRLAQIRARVDAEGRVRVSDLALELDVSEMTIRRDLEKLAVLVGETGAIGVDASTTLQRLARSIDGARDLTVVTNGPEAFAALQDRPGVTALLTGGQLDRRTGSLVGPLAARAARDVALRRLFVSAAGIDPSGTTETTLEEADVKLALADVSGEIVVAVDHTKLGQRGSEIGR